MKIFMTQVGQLIRTAPLSGFMESAPVHKNRRFGAVLALILVMAVFALPGSSLAKLWIMKGKIVDTISGEDIAELERQEIAKIIEERLYWGRMVAAKNPSLTSFEINEIGKAVLRYSGEYGLSPELIVAIIKVESSGRVSAVSSRGAQGLMQVMPFWKKELGIEGTLFDIDTNIKAGTHILAGYIKKHGYDEGIARYYRGTLKVDAQGYHMKVLNAMQV
ncbi:membrane-bound lytic murein transglycosylase E [uncultured bacterium]|nr:membrane-bound lytic murein transglycosylase E [uncultured bacterium]